MINPNDDALLKNLFDDNQRIEPEWYCPIVPMVLINGAEGIGTGWSTKIPNYDIREVVANIKRLLDGLDPIPMVLSNLPMFCCLFPGQGSRIVQVVEHPSRDLKVAGLSFLEANFVLTFFLAAMHTGEKM